MDEQKELIPYERLTLTNDFLFCKVFTTHHELLKNLIHLVTGEEIEGFVEVNNQKTVSETIDGKGIRCDVYAVEEGRKVVYDIEMQTTTKKDLPRRVRYYQSAIDSANLEKGDEYTELPNSCIIFICTERLFDSDRQFFWFITRDKIDPSIQLSNGAAEIFLTSKGNDKTLPQELKKFLEYLNSGTITSKFTEDLEKAVVDAKQNRTWKEEYKMKSLIELDARYAGKDEGKKEGRKEGRLEDIMIAIRKGGEEAAIEFLNASREEIQEAKEWAKNKTE